jgi:hypothetical protein
VAKRFDPLRLFPDASLNRTVLAALPGADAGWVGQPAFDLLSLAALRSLAHEMGVVREMATHRLTWALAQALAAPDRQVSGRAAELAEVFGRRLGHLVATLTTYPAAATSQDSAWRTCYLRHWSRVEHVWLGGGIAAALGQHLLAGAREEARRLITRHWAIEVAPDAAILALVGAGRIRLEKPGQRIVLDFGQTAVKRGVAIVSDDSLQHLQRLPDVPVHLKEGETPPDVSLEFVVDTIARTFRTAQDRGFALEHDVLASVASYVIDGRPFDRRGLYAPLGSVDPRDLEERLRQRAGAALHLAFVHDGTAAAHAVGAPRPSAVILMGTALGVGFPAPTPG